MQTLDRKNPTKLSSQTRKIATGAILLFALSGLISGFAVGAFVHLKPATGTTHGTGSGTTPIAQNTRTPVITRTPEIVWLGEPDITDFTYSERANSSTNYTLSALIVDKNKNPIQATDVTCKLLLTKEGSAMDATLKADNSAIPRDLDKIQQAFPGEIVNALNFISPTQQMQPCIPNSKTTWNYTVSPSVEPGIYYLFVFADWQGKHYNWYWKEVIIKKAG